MVPDLGFYLTLKMAFLPETFRDVPRPRGRAPLARFRSRLLTPSWNSLLQLLPRDGLPLQRLLDGSPEVLKLLLRQLDLRQYPLRSFKESLGESLDPARGGEAV